MTLRNIMRVQLNGLKPFEMKRDIHLPSGAIKEVELQYEKLDKHCFKCKSLTHEDSHCPSKVPADLRGKGPSSMDTSPRNTINRLEERKHKYHERQQAKVDTFVKHATQQKLQWPHSSSSIRGEERWVAKGTSNEQTPRRSFHSETHSRDGHSRLGSLQYYRSEYRSRPDGRETRSPPPPHGQQRRQLTQGIGGNSGGLRSQDKSLPPEESASRSYHSPRGKSSARPHQLSSERRERPSQVSPQDPYSSERVPALERLSGQTQSHNTPPTE